MLDCGLDLERVPRRGGAYVLVLHLGRARRVRIGALGVLGFRRGFYCYVGSAKSGLQSRLARHLRTRGKRKHWHIDYLRAVTRLVRLLVADDGAGECALSRRVAGLSDGGVQGFGSSDCCCPTHLHYFGADPGPYVKKGRID